MASELLVNKITPESGTTLTLGDTGDTISFASGVLPTLESLTITGDLTVDTNTLKVDSTNNRVGIGTSSPSYILHITEDGGGAAARINLVNSGVATGDDTLLSFLSGSNNNENIIYFGDADDTNVGQIRYDHAFDSMEFYTNASEQMRITSSGDVGIGTNNPTGKLHVQDNTGSLSATNDTTAEFRRADGTYGPRLQIRHSTTGSDINHTWSSSAPNLTFSVAQNERMRIDSSGHVIIPNGVTLGTAAGTYNAANTIDDYEEGTFTPSVGFSSADPTAGRTTGTGRYTKVGQMVTVHATVVNFNVTGASGDLQIQDLPFTSTLDASLIGYNGSVKTSVIGFQGDIGYLSADIPDNTSYIRIVENRDNLINDFLNTANCNDGTSDIYVTVSYLTDS